ncbi:RNA polymerase sigma factor [Chitinophaga pinensis]|uniref:Sigma-70 family RNA polymerase sigma factor n=1 Tax=Chitinophaga pinensis TaxID=79329 RepID=A0A5C6LMN1_9BACT|nr:sigma-70 family RNA polymerase sigma factor [Chitinophaga pinensis]TWV94303.1 sigma-70 family RNA polymerase sigma factor [Chitinophaga pinensis]
MNPLNINRSEDELFLLFQQGNEAAFGILYDRYVDLLFLHALYQLQDDTIAKDAVQDVLVYMWNNHANIKIKTNIKTYLIGAIRQRCADLIRKEVSLRNRQQVYAAMTTSVTGTSPLEVKELHKQIQSAMSFMSPGSRKAFEMSYLEKKTSKEIAHIMNIKVQTVKNHVQQALKVLRQRLKKIRFSPVLFSLLLLHISAFITLWDYHAGRSRIH